MSRSSTPRERRLSLELKYAAIAIATVGAFVVLRGAGAFRGVNDTITSGVSELAGLGAIGVFVIALVANVSIIIQIPYTLPLLSAALGGASVQAMIVLGLASGIGAGIGAVLAYKVADSLVAHREIPSGRLFTWITTNLERRPRAASTIIFLVALSPLPDGTVVVPLAMVHYGMRRLMVPVFLGKLAHNVLLALLFTAFASWAKQNVSEQASTDLALAIAVLFMLLIAYQAEKARSGESDAVG